MAINAMCAVRGYAGVAQFDVGDGGVIFVNVYAVEKPIVQDGRTVSS